MKYLKTFEHFTGTDLDLGHRFSEEEESEKTPFPFGMEEEEYGDSLRPVVGGRDEEEEEDCETCGEEEGSEDLPYQSRTTMARSPRVWGDEVVEAKKAKPDFLDLDKDGDKKESMKKAAKEAKAKKDSDKEDKSDNKSLSAGQKKLPPALQKAILAKKKK